MAEIIKRLESSTTLSGTLAEYRDGARPVGGAPRKRTPTDGSTDYTTIAPKKSAPTDGKTDADSAPAVRYVSTRAAAQILDLKPQTLAKWRWSGRGPRYVKLNGAVRYALGDLLAFADAGRRRSTSDQCPVVPGHQK